MSHSWKLSHFFAGFSAVLVGYTSSVVIVMQAALAAGANPEQVESWLLVLGLIMGVSSIGFSWWYKVPILTAWSTPGAAFLVANAGNYSLHQVIGACLFAGVLTVISGFIRPLHHWLQNLPASLSTAMLAAILLPFCIKGFSAASQYSDLFLILLVTYFAIKAVLPKYTMASLLLVTLIYALFNHFFDQPIQLTFSTWQWMTPTFDGLAILNLALPLYLLTMLSQNLPGIAMVRQYHFSLPVKPVFVSMGLLNTTTASLGGFSINLAAISAALCLNEDVDKEASQRYRSAIWAGVFYLFAGVFATTVVSIFTQLPQGVTVMLASFALLGTLMMCLSQAFQHQDYREAALVTFLVILSGVNVAGVSATLWGLIAGGLVLQASKWKKR